MKFARFFFTKRFLQNGFLQNLPFLFGREKGAAKDGF